MTRNERLETLAGAYRADPNDDRRAASLHRDLHRHP